MHHSAGLSLAPQAYAADHIALFSAPDRTIRPVDREHIGLNAKYLRTVSLRVISICPTAGKRMPLARLLLYFHRWTKAFLSRNTSA